MSKPASPPITGGIVYALAAAALFGASTPFAKLLVGRVEPVLLAGLLYLGSGCGLFAWRWLGAGGKRQGPQEAPMRRADLPWLAGAGLSARQRFVQALYLAELGRAGSAAELDSQVAVRKYRATDFSCNDGIALVCNSIVKLMQIAYQSDTWAERKSGPVRSCMDIEGLPPSNESLQRIGGGKRKWESRWELEPV